MTGAAFAALYLDPPSGVLYVAYPNQRDNGTGDKGKPHFLRPKIADALRRARRNKAMGMTDAAAVATLPAYCTKYLTQAAGLHDQNGTMLCPNIVTDFNALSPVEPVGDVGSVLPA